MLVLLPLLLLPPLLLPCCGFMPGTIGSLAPGGVAVTAAPPWGLESRTRIAADRGPGCLLNASRFSFRASLPLPQQLPNPMSNAIYASLKLTGLATKVLGDLVGSVTSDVQKMGKVRDALPAILGGCAAL